jgi:hypothetical protein
VLILYLAHARIIGRKVCKSLTHSILPYCSVTTPVHDVLFLFGSQRMPARQYFTAGSNSYTMNGMGQAGDSHNEGGPHCVLRLAMPCFK